MPFALAIADTAAEDLNELIDSLPLGRQEPALAAIENVCMALAQGPLPPSRAWQTPTFPVEFVIDDVRHYWAGTYRLSPDETTLVITHLFRRVL